MATATTTDFSDLSLLGLMQLVSPALPIGAFAWSQGLESAFELGWVNNEVDLNDWLSGVLEDGLVRCELPVLVKLQRAWSDGAMERVESWNEWLHAVRETRELSEEDHYLGSALVRLLRQLDLLPPSGTLPMTPGYVTMFAWAAHVRQVPERQMLLGFGWTWLEGQLGVACKALPLGHTAAQRLIEIMRVELVHAVDKALVLEDEELGPTLPGLALASAQHETQYSRLFRS